jgi:hypothetical protein
VKRILVTGSRDWENRNVILLALGEALGELSTRERDEGNPDWRAPENYLLIHGDCPTGADAIADRIWRELGLPVLARPALWKVWGKKAGPLRNKHMVDLGADLCLAFIAPGSRGAAGCAKLAETAGIETRRTTP